MYKLILFSISLTLLSINSWANEPIPQVTKGSIEQVSPFTSAIINDKFLNIWLPPGYSKDQRYDVLYMHDGRMLFDAKSTWNQQEWQVDEVAGRLIEQGKIRPIIIVGIPNAGPKRHSEYFPQKPFESLSKANQIALYQGDIEKKYSSNSNQVTSDKYLQFIVKDVIPYIEQNYPVNKGGKHRYLGGSSMGGLISWYGLMQYPNEFTGAISMSTHWPGGFDTNEAFFTALLRYLTTHINVLNTHKVYFDHGDATLDRFYPPLQKEVDKLFKAHNYPTSQWRSLFFPGEDHTENAWAKRLHIPLEFMFATKKAK